MVWIVERAIQLAREGNVVTVVADDTDILAFYCIIGKKPCPTSTSNLN